MARQGFDFKKMLLASLLIIAIGIVFSVISIILQIIPVVTPEDLLSTVSLIGMIYTILLFPIFVVLFLWSGMRAAKNYGFDVVGAGFVAAFSYFIIAMVNLLVNAVLALIVVSKPIDNFGFGSLESVISSVLFSGVTGISGVGLSALCGLGITLVGIMINFVVGGLGAWIVLRKRV
ncbi:Uncharacterised protein [Candidatus Bilamarchaeum dharawalense]|uniref:Uncharacterized protein n=1 Tax=Candidatus Bilamarchaeum dharawalense TaxID=2885759 RepID=A0A5E4LM09_9ARCH|nr:Uncharacterised protein [Candidatus Bilamarchaeum dharawalense]